MTVPEDPEIRVTRIGKRWHCRLMYSDIYHDEMACQNQQDIGWCCREMLRWFVKTGGQSVFADAARRRQTAGPIGKVWYHNQLQKQKKGVDKTAPF